jgi:hypothetical protein
MIVFRFHCPFAGVCGYIICVVDLISFQDVEESDKDFQACVVGLQKKHLLPVIMSRNGNVKGIKQFEFYPNLFCGIEV